MARRSKAERAQIWTQVHAERQALISDLDALTVEQWQTASLCDGWTVHDVTAHLVDNAKASVPDLVVSMVRARFNFHEMTEQAMRRSRGATPAETLTGLRAVADRTDTPPVDLASRLVEEIMHGEDIRRPLGLHRDYPTGALQAALVYQLGAPDSIGGARTRLGSVRLVATDAGVDASFGDGPEIRGPLLELLLLASGRGAHATHLTGPGLATLAASSPADSSQAEPSKADS